MLKPMETSSSHFFLHVFVFFFFFIHLFQLSHSKTTVVDGVSEWKNPTVLVGDTLIFKHKHHYKLYIFKNLRAFKHCNFTEATLLTKLNSTSFTWHPSRLGFFYFTFNNGSLKSCEDNAKLAIRVSPRPHGNQALSPEIAPLAAPSPTTGGVVSSSPAYHLPFNSSSSPSPAPSSRTPAKTVSPIVPDTGGGIPFINSNPAVPLPTGETDAATIRPLPTSSGYRQQVVALLVVRIPICWILFAFRW